MKSAIIKSQTSLRRYPILAFIMSFLFTGLGQMYNGDFSKGIALFILRIFSLIFVPLYVIIQNKFSMIVVIVAAAVHLFVWIFSSAEAASSAKDKLAYNLKRYNSFLLYIVYMLINSGLMTFCILLIISLFSINQVTTDDMNPSLLKNDYILINKYAAKIVVPGDIISFHSNNSLLTGRLLAANPDMVTVKAKNYFINDSALTYSVIPKPVMEKLGLANSEDLFFEINGEKKYPVLIKPEKKIKDRTVESIIPGTEELFIAFDNRVKNNSHFTVNAGFITGRVEGIVYSKEIKKIFNPINPANK